MRRARVGLIAVVTVLAGCTGTPPADPAAAPTSPTPASSSASAPAGGAGSGHEWTATSTIGPAPGASPPAAAGLHLSPVAHVRLPAGMRVVGLALSGTRLAWSGCSPCAGAAQDASDVYVADLPAGRPRWVARTAFRWGSTTVVGLSDQVLVWLDGADVRDGAVPHTLWALRALDLRTGDGWTIASGGNPDDPARAPIAFVSGGRVTWQVFDFASAHGPVRVADLHTRAVRTAEGALPGLLRGTSPAGLVHIANDPGEPRDPDAAVPVDAYLTPAGGNSSALTSAHDVIDATVGAGRLLWSTKHGDDEALWSLPLTGGSPTRLFTGPVLAFAAGRGFGVWATRETDSVVQVGAGGRAETLPDVPADGRVLAVDGDRLAILTVPARGVTTPVTIAVTRVASRP